MNSKSSRGRRRGTIEARGPDRWRIRVTTGKDPQTGNPIRVAVEVRGSRRDAERALTDLLGKLDQGASMPRGQLTLGSWLEEFAQVWSSGLAPQTRENAVQALRTYVPPALRATRLRALTSAELQALFQGLEARRLSPATVANFYRVLNSRLEKAVALGHLARNPLEHVTTPAVPRREYRVLSPEEAAVFLEEAERDTYGPLWTLLLLTGLRPEEALGLKWPDLEGSELKIRRALVRLAGGVWQLAETKTRKARSLPLPGTLLRILQRHRARQAEHRLALGGEYESHDLIFAGTFGAPLFWSNLAARHFHPLLGRVAARLTGAELPALPQGPGTRLTRREARQALEAATRKALATTGLARMRPYDLRHSAATLLLAAGEHPKVVSELLGHSKITLTLDTYSHVTPGLLEKATTRLEELVQAGAARRLTLS